ncbi:MAG TPA: methyltransferase domain-containing protein [Thermoanaerobaculia bacterium]|nr:methyltransferase domain-containing protein [Thermoanaerobaculia bacterium]
MIRRAFKLVYILYYRLLYGRRIPFADRLERRVREWEHQTGRGDAPISREQWEEQYRAGKWELMRSTDELARYSVIAGYLHHFHPGGSVLDVGSGEGLLLDHLRPFSRYLGIDLSEEAVRLAARRTAERASFLAANAEEYRPTERWDSIVFNECVYYFEDPIATVLGYREGLEEGGTLIVSTFRSRRADVVAKRLIEKLPLLEEVAVTNRKGTWVVRVFRSSLP